MARMSGQNSFNIARHEPATGQSGRKALLVLGMSRSGTSLLTNALHTLGAALPRDLLPPGPGNPFGHFEPRGLVALNDVILKALGRSWDDPRPIPPHWFRSVAAHTFQRQIRDQLAADFEGEALVVVKDPRVCRLLPMYIDVLDTMDIEPLAILQVRPVAEVARSLSERDNIAAPVAELLWLRSVVEAEWQSRFCRRVWVSMAETMVDWPGTARRIADALLLRWPRGEDAETGCAGPRLSHRLTPPPLRGDPAFALAANAWAAVELGLRGEESAARAAFDAVRAMLEDFDRVTDICRHWGQKPLLGTVRARLRALATGRRAG